MYLDILFKSILWIWWYIDQKLLSPIPRDCIRLGKIPPDCTRLCKIPPDSPRCKSQAIVSKNRVVWDRLKTKIPHRLNMGLKTRLSTLCTKWRQNPNLLTPRKINTRLAHLIGPENLQASSYTSYNRLICQPSTTDAPRTVNTMSNWPISTSFTSVRTGSYNDNNQLMNNIVIFANWNCPVVDHLIMLFLKLVTTKFKILFVCLFIYLLYHLSSR